MGGFGDGGLGVQDVCRETGGVQDGAYRSGARDERLGLFAEGQWADTARGSGWLALQAGDVSRPEVLAQATTDEVLGVGRTWKALETWTFSQKIAVIRELVRRHPLDERWEPGGLPSEWAPELHQEVGAALAISPVAAGKLIHLAWTLEARLPGIGQALEDNRLDPARARLIVDGTSVLDDDLKFAMAERIILDGLPHCKTWSALERLVERAVISVDPDGAERRRRKAEREHARLRFWRESCGTCAIQGVGLPADEALAAMAHIEGRVQGYRDAGINRRVDILRVMAFADLINGVTVAQRAAWARAEDAACQAEDAARGAGEDAEEAERQARGKACHDSKGGDTTRRSETGDGPDDDGPEDPGGPSGGGPGDNGPGGGYPGDWPDWPADSGGYGDDLDGDFGAGPGDVRDRGACPACGGVGQGIGLPVRANLTVPAGALEWLAGWSAEHAGTPARGPTGSGSGGGGPGGECGCEASGMIVREDLAFPVFTLLGVADRPGEAHGLGALDPALVRNLAAVGARHPGSRFCLTVADDRGYAIGHACCRPMRGKKGRAVPINPDRATIARSGRTGPDGGFGSWIITLPGAPLPLIADIHPVPTYDCDHRFESSRHDPGDMLRHLVQVRDGKCSFPVCARGARETDFEHAQPYDKGGRTCACNAHACSRSCHRAKQSRGWRVAKPRPGWAQWTTRAGRTYLQGPWSYPT
jgi:hypothetical protein